jgi:predicted oxidoreductase
MICPSLPYGLSSSRSRATISRSTRAAGEVAGFGGGGVHGYAALEGTFLGGCIFSGRAAGRAVAASVG